MFCPFPGLPRENLPSAGPLFWESVGVTASLPSFSIDPLGVTSGPGAKGTNFVLEGAAVLNIGAKMMKTMPVFRGFGAYFLVDQQLSRVGRDANGDKDYWNPALVWGGLLQIAPWP